MSDSFTDLHYHIVFSTKRREASIKSEIRQSVCQYIGGITRKLKGRLLACGGMANHLHVLASLRPDMTVSSFVRSIKANSSKWINEKRMTETRFQWQSGYGAFTVSHSNLAVVTRYIDNQPEHHRHRTFAEELESLLIRHNCNSNRKTPDPPQAPPAGR